MTDSVSLPLFKEMIPGGLSYGANYLVEFEPQSLWYETSLTIAAQGLRQGLRTDYHTFMHMPTEIRTALSSLGLTLPEFEEDDRFRIEDSYTATTFLQPPHSRSVWEHYEKSLDLKEWGQVNSGRD